MNNKIFRHVFYVSDSTGITVESIGRSVLTQFADFDFSEKTISFIDTPQKLEALITEINAVSQTHGERPIVFFTFAHDDHVEAISKSQALTLNCLAMFITPISKEIGRDPIQNKPPNKLMDSKSFLSYQRRIDALNYTMNNDDGVSVRDFEQADIILIGVSRSGKTPTSLYLALHYGVFAANYPLVDEDFANDSLPLPLKKHLNKLYGLLIAPKRLAQLREQRRPSSQYAKIKKCEEEVNAARRIFEASGISYLDVTSRSVEELSSKIMQEANLPRYL